MADLNDLEINISSPENSIFCQLLDLKEISPISKLLQKSLLNSEISLALIFETVPNGIVILNKTGKILAANVTAEKILRLTRSDIKNRVYDDPRWRITSLDQTPFPKEKLPFFQVIQTGQLVYGVEHCIQHDDGTEIILSINAAPLKNAQGEIISVVASFNDITQQKYAEARLRESEQRYHSVIETAAEGIVLQQADGKILACNSSAEQILGLSAEQMMGRSSIDSRWQALYEDGTPFPGEHHPAMITLRTGKPQTNVVMGIHKPDGTLTWISANTRALFAPGETKPYGVVASFFDITERKKTQEQLLVSDAALQQMPNAIILSNLDGKIERWMGKAEEIFGYTAAEIIGNSLSYLYSASQQERILQSIQKNGFFCGELIGLKRSGATIPIETTAKPVYDAKGNPIFLISLHQDISDRKRAEQDRQQAQLERMQLIQEQAARVEAELAQQRSTFLAQASGLLNSSLDYEKTLKRVAQLTVPVLADWCAVDLINENDSLCRLAVAHRDPQKVQYAWELHQRYPVDRNASYGVAKVLRTGKTEYGSEIPDELLVQSARDEEHLAILRELGLTSYIITPLIARGVILGTISLIMAESQRRYTEVDLGLVEDLAHRAAIALDNARLYWEAQQAKQVAEEAAARTNRLQRITAALSESLTLSQVADVIMRHCAEALEAEMAFLALVHENESALEMVRATGDNKELNQAHQCFSINAPFPLAEAVRTRKMIAAQSKQERMENYPHLASAYSKLNFEGWISIPLIIEGKAIGGISLAFVEMKTLSEEEEGFLWALAGQCAQAIDRARLYEANEVARQEAESASRVKDEFLAIVSHELRTPLNAILGWSQMLRSRKLNQNTIERALETIERNARSQKQLIEDLLDVSRIIRGKVHLNIHRVNLVSVVQAAIDAVTLAAESKKISIETQFDSSLALVSGDSERLQQVVWNLLSNAVKFTPNNGFVTISLHQIGDYIHLQISDTGIGIAPDFLPYVFEYFRQADQALIRSHNGLGLGLAIVRHLVELHGGTIEARSEGIKQGATFIVKLPTLPESNQDGKPKSNDFLITDPEVLEASLALKGTTVLVVDDELDSLDMVTFILEQSGANVIAVSSAGEALLALKQFNPQILVSDIAMPKEDGYSLIKQVRNLPSRKKHQIPAIALTAYAREQDRQQALEAGFNEHITKPIEPLSLIRAIANLLENS